MNIAQRLTALIVGAGAALLIVGGNAYYQFSNVAQHVGLLKDVLLDDVTNSAAIKNHFKQEQIDTYAYLLEQDAAVREQHAASIPETRAKLAEVMKTYA